MRCLFRSFFPILYQGFGKRDRYFEGWYFKHSTGASSCGCKGARSIAFIPGISRSAAGDHSFVQMIDGATGMTRYFRYAPEDFSTQDSPFQVRLGKNLFSLSGISLDLEDEAGKVKAKLEYGKLAPPKRSLFRPGVMGPYSFVPFMECYHGLASMDHGVKGSIRLDHADGTGETVEYVEGRGYIEKDWGRSMPESWVWIQSNTFDPCIGPTSFFFSLARIPWRGGSFNGFISILYTGGVEYRFATYTGARLELLEHHGRTIRLLAVDKNYKLEVMVRRSREGSLAAPVDGVMDRRISECADAVVRVVLKSRHGNSDVPVFDSSSSASGVELVGDPDSLKPNLRP